MIAPLARPMPDISEETGISDNLHGLEQNKRLGVEELNLIAKRTCDASTAEEAVFWSDEFMKGFYGTK
jgi:hypothetical protein